jgi:arylsulfatase
VGYDSGDNVSAQYKNPGEFTGGTIQGVAIDVSDTNTAQVSVHCRAPWRPTCTIVVFALSLR